MGKRKNGLPPARVDKAEQCLLSCLFKDPSLIERAREVIRPDTFGVAFHRDVYAAQQALYEECGTFTPDGVAARLQSADQWFDRAGVLLWDLCDMTATGGEFYIYFEEVRWAAECRALVYASTETITSISNPNASYRDLAEEARRRFAALEADAVGRAGGGATAFLRERVIWAADLMAKEFPPQQFLVEDILTDVGLSVLGGRFKSGKSWWALQLARCVSTGEPFLGRRVLQGPVAYLALEDGERRIRLRMAESGQRWPQDAQVAFLASLPPGKGGWLETVAALADGTVLGVKPRLIIVDTLTRARNGRGDENSSTDMAGPLYAAGDLAREHGLHILVTHHHGKGDRRGAGDDLRGSSAIGAAADTILGLYRAKENEPAELEVEGRDVEGRKIPLVFGRDAERPYTWQPATVEPGAAVNQNERKKMTADDEAFNAVRALVKSTRGGWVDADAVAHHMKKSRQKVKPRLDALVAGGALVMQPAPEGTQAPALYAPAPTDEEVFG
jgi:replicative DNA helicase